MQTWIALLRAVNVGGKNPLPMQPLRAALAALGHSSVRTYIQSGNCIFQSAQSDAAAIAANIVAAIATAFGIQTQVIALTMDQLHAAILANPFAADDPKTVHLFFLAQPPENAAPARLERLKADSELFALTQSVFYLHAPQGIGRSKLAAQAERALGVATTARSLRSVLHIAAIAEETAV